MNQVIRGVSVPKIGLGTWELSGDECIETIRQAAEIGYRHFDTAVRYANEESVGTGLAQTGLPRNELFVTTKVWITDLAKESINEVVGRSLDRLRLDYVDLLLIHWPSPHFTVQYTVESLSIAKTAGQALNIGVSNYPPKLLRDALSHAEHHGHKYVKRIKRIVARQQPVWHQNMAIKIKPKTTKRNFGIEKS